MSLLTKNKFSFTSKATDKDSFTVVSFKGFEAISKPYQFEIVLVSEKTDIDPLQVLQNTAVFTIHRDNEQDVIFNGILIQFEETQEFNGYLFFKAVLAPKLQWLSMTHHNQVFLDQPVPKVMEAMLIDADLLPGIDFEFRVQNEYQPVEYICQYGESHLNFVSRWAEREGIYYFFEQTEQGEKVVFTDTKISQTDLVLGKNLIYTPQSGLDSLHTKEVIKEFLCKHNLLPQQVFLKDYNYRKPSLAIEGTAEVDPEGRGENYIYGEHFPTPEEGNRLAKIRAEELFCRKSIFFGKSSAPFMEPGFTFDLQEHYKKDYNRKYLITDINHEGHQTGYLISGITAAVEPRDEQMFYSNTFTAIYSDVQFRPERTAVKPKVSGTVNAKVDAAASGQYAELDDMGRYKVTLPFDRSGRGSGKASAWCRMMQPYAGADYGMHFPLHKGIEVLLTFIDGDPDRPIIAGAVPNPETATPVTGKNQTRSIIKTGGGNAIALEDSEGGQLVKISSPTESSFLRIGAPNPSAPPGINIGTNNEMTTVVGNHAVTQVGADYKVTIGGKEYKVTTGDVVREFHSNSHKITKGNQTEETYGNKTSTVIGNTKETFTGTKVTDSLAATQESFVGVKSSQALAATSELFVGIKQTACAAAEISTTAALKYEKSAEHIINAPSKLDKITGPCKEMVGTYDLTSLGTLELDASGNIKINSSSKITLIAPEIVLDGNVTINKKLVAKKDVTMNKKLKVKQTATDKNSDR